MNPEEILSRLRQAPFEPFRICLSDGTSYDVPHPELALLTTRVIAVAVGPFRGEVPQRFVQCSLLHVTRLEPLEGASASQE